MINYQGEEKKSHNFSGTIQISLSYSLDSKEMMTIRISAEQFTVFDTENTHLKAIIDSIWNEKNFIPFFIANYF